MIPLLFSTLSIIGGCKNSKNSAKDRKVYTSGVREEVESIMVEPLTVFYSLHHYFQSLIYTYS